MHKMIIEKTIKNISTLSLSRIFVQDFSVNYYQRICGIIYIPVKFLSFSIFFWTPLDKCVWRKKIILWDSSYLRNSNNINTVKVSLQLFWWNCNKNKIYMPYFRKQKWLFLAFSLSDMHIDFDFARPFFYVLDRAWIIVIF